MLIKYDCMSMGAETHASSEKESTFQKKTSKEESRKHDKKETKK